MAESLNKSGPPNKADIALRSDRLRVLATELYLGLPDENGVLQRLSQEEIARRLGVTRNTVQEYLTQAQDRWAKSNLLDFDAIKREQLAHIDALEIIYLDAWQRSQEGVTTQTDSEDKWVPMGTGAEGEDSIPELEEIEELESGRKKRKHKHVVNTRMHASSTGDIRFLQGIQWCIEQRFKVIGAYAPTKIAPTDPSGQYAYDPSALRDKLNVLIEATKDQIEDAIIVGGSDDGA